MKLFVQIIFVLAITASVLAGSKKNQGPKVCKAPEVQTNYTDLVYCEVVQEGTNTIPVGRQVISETRMWKKTDAEKGKPAVFTTETRPVVTNVFSDLQPFSVERTEKVDWEKLYPSQYKPAPLPPPQPKVVYVERRRPRSSSYGTSYHSYGFGDVRGIGRVRSYGYGDYGYGVGATRTYGQSFGFAAGGNFGVYSGLNRGRAVGYGTRYSSNGTVYD